LAQENLIDLYRFMLHPIILGQGKRLFADGVERRVLALTATKAFKGGIVVVEYVPAKNA
jgi:dihydrofolate reductase